MLMKIKFKTYTPINLARVAIHGLLEKKRARKRVRIECKEEWASSRSNAQRNIMRWLPYTNSLFRDAAPSRAYEAMAHYVSWAQAVRQRHKDVT